MYRSFQPTSDLAPFVECYWSWRVSPGREPLDDILPDAAPEFIVQLAAIPFVEVAPGQWQRQHRAFLYCAAERAVRLSIREPARIFAVRFRPWGVARFAEQSMAVKLDRPVPPEEALPGTGNELARALIEAESDACRVGVANEQLRKALRHSAHHDRRLEQLLAAVDGGRCSPGEMARKLAMSDRSFRRLWADVVGIPPRRFIQLMRFHLALAKIDAGHSLARVAADCGYSDQPHMARQIKAISGLAASALRRRLGNRVYRDLYTARPDAPWQPHGEG